MRVFSSLVLILLCPFVLAACGFTPLYGTRSPEGNSPSSLRSSFSQVEVSLIPDRSGQTLRNLLIDRLYSGGYPVNPSYTLKMEKLAEANGGAGVTVSELARLGGVSDEKADAILTNLAETGELRLEVNDEGDLLYYPKVQRLRAGGDDGV